MVINVDKVNDDCGRDGGSNRYLNAFNNKLKDVTNINSNKINTNNNININTALKDKSKPKHNYNNKPTKIPITK